MFIGKSSYSILGADNLQDISLMFVIVEDCAMSFSRFTIRRWRADIGEFTLVPVKRKQPKSSKVQKPQSGFKKSLLLVFKDQWSNLPPSSEYANGIKSFPAS